MVSELQGLAAFRHYSGFPSGAVVKNLPDNTGDMGGAPGLGTFPWRRKWQFAPIFLLGRFHGQRSLVDYRPGVAKNQTKLSD